MRLLIPLLFNLTVVSLAGCQTYSPWPLDLDAHAVEWRDRRANDSTVRHYAASLRSDEHEPAPARADFDPAAGIELSQAEWVALVYNPDLRLARSDRAVAQVIAEHAGLWDDPVIGLDVLRILAGAPPGGPWIIGSAISVTLPLSGRLQSEKLLAAASLEVSLLRVLEQERETIRLLRRRWLEWSVLYHRIALTDDLLAELESITAAARRLAELGEMLTTEASLFEIEQIAREIERDVLVERQRAAEEGIRVIMGLPPDALLRPIPQVAFGSDGANVGQDLSCSGRQSSSWQGEPCPTCLERANPELARLRAAYAAAEEMLHLEVRRQYPDLTIGPQYEIESNQSRIGFIAGFPLPILNANRQGIAEAEQNRERARAEFETAYERLVGRMSEQRWLVNAARIERRQIESRLAPLIDRQVSNARQLLDIGEGSPLALLEGIVRRHEAKLRVLEAIAAEGEAAIELIHLRGG